MRCLSQQNVLSSLCLLLICLLFLFIGLFSFPISFSHQVGEIVLKSNLKNMVGSGANMKSIKKKTTTTTNKQTNKQKNKQTNKQQQQTTATSNPALVDFKNPWRFTVSVSHVARVWCRSITSTHGTPGDKRQLYGFVGPNEKTALQLFPICSCFVFRYFCVCFSYLFSDIFVVYDSWTCVGPFYDFCFALPSSNLLEVHYLIRPSSWSFDGKIHSLFYTIYCCSDVWMVGFGMENGNDHSLTPGLRSRSPKICQVPKKKAQKFRRNLKQPWNYSWTLNMSLNAFQHKFKINADN